MAKINLRIDQLNLDLENPRTGKVSNQRDALQRILDEQGDKLAELALDISSEGLNPMDNLLVLKDGSSKYTVVEGNRRTACLKILTNPAVLGGLDVSAQTRKKLEKAALSFSKARVEPITAFCLTERQDVKKWLYLRHTGQNNGRGLVDWTGVATARFRGTSPALQAIDFVKSFGELTNEQLILIDAKFPITTLDRLFSSPETRELIGIGIEGGKLKTNLAAEELIKPLKKIILDLARKEKRVDDLKTKNQQVEYIKSFSPEDKPKKSNRKVDTNVDDLRIGAVPAVSGKVKSKSKRSSDPSKRLKIVPAGLKLHIASSKVASIFNELKILKLEENANACAVLLRVFLELSVDHYSRENKLEVKYTDQKSGKRIEKKLKVKVAQVIDHLVSAKGCSERDFSKILRGLEDKNSPLSIDLLHNYVHNLFEVPVAKELRAAWDGAEPLFKNIWT